MQLLLGSTLTVMWLTLTTCERFTLKNSFQATWEKSSWDSLAMSACSHCSLKLMYIHRRVLLGLDQSGHKEPPAQAFGQSSDPGQELQELLTGSSQFLSGRIEVAFSPCLITYAHHLWRAKLHRGTRESPAHRCVSPNSFPSPLPSRWPPASPCPE